MISLTICFLQFLKKITACSNTAESVGICYPAVSDKQKFYKYFYGAPFLLTVKHGSE